MYTNIIHYIQSGYNQKNINLWFTMSRFFCVPASRIRYEITSGNIGGAFAVKNMTGAIYVAGALDYETRKRVSINRNRKETQDSRRDKEFENVKKILPNFRRFLRMLPAPSEVLSPLRKHIDIMRPNALPANIFFSHRK